MKEVLDLCCGGRHWWFQKEHPGTIYMDIRNEPKGSIELQPNWSVEPDVLGSWEDIPFDDESFSLVAWDLPHKINESKGLIIKKYGFLGPDWKASVERGSIEAFRVLKPGGTLIVKHSNVDVSVKELLEAIGKEPLFGTRTKKGVNETFFFVFHKPSLT